MKALHSVTRVPADIRRPALKTFKRTHAIYGPGPIAQGIAAACNLPGTQKVPAGRWALLVYPAGHPHANGSRQSDAAFFNQPFGSLHHPFNRGQPNRQLSRHKSAKLIVDFRTLDWYLVKRTAGAAALTRILHYLSLQVCRSFTHVAAFWRTGGAGPAFTTTETLRLPCRGITVLKGGRQRRMRTGIDFRA